MHFIVQVLLRNALYLINLTGMNCISLDNTPAYPFSSRTLHLTNIQINITIENTFTEIKFLVLLLYWIMAVESFLGVEILILQFVVIFSALAKLTT